MQDTSRLQRCPNLATWHLVEGLGHDAYTYACDQHIGAMRSKDTTHAYVIAPEYPCCHLADPAALRIPHTNQSGESAYNLLDAACAYRRLRHDAYAQAQEGTQADYDRRAHAVQEARSAVWRAVMALPGPAHPNDRGEE